MFTKPSCQDRLKRALGANPSDAERDIGALLQEVVEVALGDTPLLAYFEAAQMAQSQPLGHGALVYLQVFGDLGRG